MSTYVLLTLQIPALGLPLSNRCCRCAAWGGRYEDRVTDWISAGQQSNICGTAHFSQSASTLKWDYTGLTLNFCNACLKTDKKTLSTRIFREHQGCGQDVNVCVFWWNISDWTTLKEAVFCKFDVTYLPCRLHPAQIFPVMKEVIKLDH